MSLCFWAVCSTMLRAAWQGTVMATATVMATENTDATVITDATENTGVTVITVITARKGKIIKRISKVLPNENI